MDLQRIANDLMSPLRASKQGFPHDLYTELRAAPTLLRMEPEGIDPFWAVVKHADIKEISTQPDKWLNAPRAFVQDRMTEFFANQNPIRTLLNMDPPEHREYRKVVNSWFVPRNIRALQGRMEWSAKQLVDMMADRDAWEGDFVVEVAAIHPVRLITHLFGLPDEDERYLIRLANEVFGSADPEFMRDGTKLMGLVEAVQGAVQYFNRLSDARRKEPTDDLASVIANAQIDGQPMSDLQIAGYLIVILTAGHETTRTAMAGGLHALIQHRGELAKLKARPELVGSAIEEIIRWTSPVSQFGRTASEDYRIRGTTIEKGESVCMFYGSANRDEEVFEDPFTFRVDRDPNPHLGFGVGEHFCLGASLARLEMKVFFEEFVRRVDVDSIELRGEVEYLASNFVGGIKHLPVRIQVD